MPNYLSKIKFDGASGNEYLFKDEEARLDIASTQTISGNPITLTDAAPIYAESLVVELEPKQEGSGDPSPTNIRPITGYTECEVDDVGKNLFSIEFPHSAGSSSVTYTYNLTVKPNTKYTMSSNAPAVPQAETASLYFNGGSTANNGVWTGHPQTETSDSNGALVVYVRFDTRDGGIDLYTAVQNGTYYIMMEEGESASSYEPYHSSNATIQFGQTVYGGSSNFTDGGTDETNKTITINDLFWYSGNNGLFYSEIVSDIKHGDGRYDHCISECYRTMNYAQSSSLSYGEMSVDSNGRIQLIDTRYSSTTDFKTAMGDIKLCYELATPTQLSTSPSPLKLLKGTNNITTNGTTINLGYQPDNVIGEVKGMIQDLWDYVLAH